MPKKRILEFSTYAKMGGTQQMLLEFLRHASHDKYQFSLCVLLQHDTLNEEVAKFGIEQTSLDMQGYWDGRAWWKLYVFAKKKQFDLIRTYGLKAHIIGRIVGKLLGIPVNITSVRSTDPWRKWYHVFLDRLTSGLTDLYISNSEAGRLITHQRERIPLSKIITIPNGIDLTRYDPDSPDLQNAAATYRQRFGIPLTVPVLGIVANLRKMKGHKTIIDALPQIQSHFPDVKCLFIGSDFLQGELQRYVQERGVNDMVIFTDFRRDIPELLSLLDIFLLPSSWEGFPAALLEAMAMRKPVIASSVGGIPEIIDAPHSGVLIPPQNPHALAEALLQLLRHPETASKMGQTAYKRVHQSFSIEMLVAKTEASYDHIIQTRRKA